MEFTYKAQNNRGERVRGIVQAVDKEEAIRVIEDHGLIVLSIRHRRLIHALNLAALQGIKMKDMVGFYRSLSLMIAADISIVQAVKILADQTQNARLKKILLDVYHHVNEGTK